MRLGFWSFTTLATLGAFCFVLVGSATALQDAAAKKCPNQKALITGEKTINEGQQLCERPGPGDPPSVIEWLCPKTRVITPTHKGLCSSPGSAPGFQCVADKVIKAQRCQVKCGTFSSICPTDLKKCTDAFDVQTFKTEPCPEKPEKAPPEETPGNGPPDDTPGNGPPEGGD